ncbi:prepilin peptidase [Lacinutrix chionoecetis]
MLLIINILLLIVLLFITIQDIKQRAIHYTLPIILFIFGLVKFIYLKQELQELLITVSFLILVILGLFLYFSVKSKKITNPINKAIGLGDIVFFVAIIPLFYSTTYIIFFISGMFFSVACHMLVNNRKELHVPLAGYLSIYLILFITANTLTNKELFYTHNII